jgi:serine/threonine-protein kinase
MHADRWARICQLYDEAAKIPAAEREAFLTRACGTDRPLREELQSLLALDEPAGPFLEEPAVTVAARLVAEDVPDLTGRMFGPYRIVDLLGSGGMGDVYRARDTVLGRDVAIKILPAAFGDDPDRLARFTKEAQFLASLSHPHVAAIYGVHESEGLRGLVLELVDGETLAQRIARGPMPLFEAARIARQIGEGLDAAHQRGIVHCDLKPSNIKIAADGTAKILDFGLAKSIAGREPIAAALGTASYMSPEQRRGDAVDKRTDIWAFGCVLLEMLTGRAAFHGPVIDSNEIAASGPADPLVPAHVPAGVAALLRRCLERDPRRRRRDVGDVMIDLDEALGAGARARPRRTLPRWLLAAGGVLLGAGAAITFVEIGERAEVPSSSSDARLSLLLPPGMTFPEQDSQVAVSPDGTMVAYIAASAGQAPRLLLRKFGAGSEQVMGDALDVRDPFFSPDSRSVGFVAGDTIRTMTIADGRSRVIARALRVATPSWDDGMIVFGEAGDMPTTGIRRVGEDGGPVEVLSTPARGGAEIAHLSPQMLPDGRTVMYTVARTYADAGPPTRVVVQRPGQPARVLLEDARFARYVGDSVLLYQRDRSLFATNFDLQTLSVAGPGVMLFDDLAPAGRPPWSAGGHALVYRPRNENRRLVWVERSGAETSLPAPQRPYAAPHVSPQGDRVAVEIAGENSSYDVWVLDVQRQQLSRVTTGGASRYPMWTPDGARLAVVNRRENVLYSLAPDGSDARAMVRASLPTWIASFTPDARTLVYMLEDQVTRTDLWTIDLLTNGPARPRIRTPAREYGGRISPDGRWMAYFSDAGGQFDLYVQPFATAGQSYRIPAAEGRARPREAVWGKDGRELFYRQGAEMLSVHISADVRTPPGHPAVLFERDYFATGGPGIVNYDVSRDGQRFLMLKAVEDRTPHLTVVQGFGRLIRERLRPDRR